MADLAVAEVEALPVDEKPDLAKENGDLRALLRSVLASIEIGEPPPAEAIAWYAAQRRREDAARAELRASALAKLTADEIQALGLQP